MSFKHKFVLEATGYICRVQWVSLFQSKQRLADSESTSFKTVGVEQKQNTQTAEPKKRAQTGGENLPT